MRRPALIPRAAIAALLLLAVSLAASPTRAQLRYMATLDLRERFNSNVFAGVIEQVPDPENPGAMMLRGVEAHRDLITELQPSLRLYLALPQDLVSLRYALTFQLFALTRLTDANGNESGNVMGYGNSLVLGYNHLINNRLEFGLTNRFEQGTETVNTSGNVSAGGRPGIGSLTTGSKSIANTLGLGLRYALSRQWAVAPQVETSFFTGYDHSDNPALVPPPMGLSVTAGGDLQRAFSVGQLALSLGYSYITEIRDQSITQNQAFPETLSTMTTGLSLGWRQQLTQTWSYSLDAGLAMRLAEEYDQQASGEISKLGYGEPNFSPGGGGTLQYRWRNTFRASLGYSHGLQRQLENAVSTVSNVDQVGLDLHWIKGRWRFDLFGAFRYLDNVTRDANDAEDSNDSMEVLARAAVLYVLHPAVTLELSYSLEAAVDRQQLAVISDTNTSTNQLVPVSSTYVLSQAVFGVSLAWPPPSAQDNAMNRRASEQEPLFNFTGFRAGAGGGQTGGRGIETNGRPERSDPRCGTEDADPDRCAGEDAPDRDAGDDYGDQRDDAPAP